MYSLHTQRLFPSTFPCQFRSIRNYLFYSSFSLFNSQVEFFNLFHVLFRVLLPSLLSCWITLFCLILYSRFDFHKETFLLQYFSLGLEHVPFTFLWSFVIIVIFNCISIKFTNSPIILVDAYLKLRIILPLTNLLKLLALSESFFFFLSFGLFTCW